MLDELRSLKNSQVLVFLNYTNGGKHTIHTLIVTFLFYFARIKFVIGFHTVKTSRVARLF